MRPLLSRHSLGLSEENDPAEIRIRHLPNTCQNCYFLSQLIQLDRCRLHYIPYYVYFHFKILFYFFTECYVIYENHVKYVGKNTLYPRKFTLWIQKIVM